MSMKEVGKLPGLSNPEAKKDQGGVIYNSDSPERRWWHRAVPYRSSTLRDAK